MIKTSKRRAWLALFLTLVSYSESLRSAGAESLPETVKRHEEEIKALKSEVDFIRREQQIRAGTEPKKDPVVCRRDFAFIGKQTHTPPALITGVTLPGTDIFLKLVRNGRDFDGKYWLLLASNVDELNNKKLYEGNEYKFVYRNCALVMRIEDVSMATSGLRFALNYM